MPNVLTNGRRCSLLWPKALTLLHAREVRATAENGGVAMLFLLWALWLRAAMTVLYSRHKGLRADGSEDDLCYMPDTSQIKQYAYWILRRPLATALGVTFSN